MLDGIVIRAPRQSAKGYVGSGARQARLMWGLRDDGSGAKAYFLEGAARGATPWRRLLRDATGQPIGDSRAAEARAYDLIRYRGIEAGSLLDRDDDADRFRDTWFYYLLGNTTAQTVVPLARSDDGFIVRLVLDNGTTALQPASLTVKSTLAAARIDGSGRGGKGGLRPPNVALRLDSVWRTRVGTSLQYGYDRTGLPMGEQLRFAKAGDPIMDIVSINGDGVLNLGYRVEASAQLGDPLRLKAVVRDALVLGGSVHRRRVWLDPTTRERHSIEYGIVAKGEAAAEAGFSTKPAPGEAKAELEIYVRWVGRRFQTLSTQQIARAVTDASRWVAALVWPEPSRPLDVSTRNHGDPRQAAYVISNKLAGGTPIWHLVESARGRNFGHPALDLALRVNALLHRQGILHGLYLVRDTRHAQRDLQRLWSTGSDADRQRWAEALSNRLDINFGLPELAAANGRRLAQRPMSDREWTYRRWFLAPGRP